MKRALLLPLTMILLSGCSVKIDNYHYKDAEKYTEYSETVTLDTEFTSLDVDWINGEINIVEGEKLEVKETNLKNEHKYYPMYYFADGNTFRIRYCVSGTISQEMSNTAKKLEITVPSSLMNINIDTVTAGYSINDTLLSSINIDNISGNGEIVTGYLETLDVDTVSGSIKADILNSSNLKEIDIDSVSGNATLNLDGKRGYNLEFDSVSGIVEKEFEEGSDDVLSNFDIDFDSVSGCLFIKKIYCE